MKHSELLSFLVNECGICGCSNVDEAPQFLMDLLEAGSMRDCGQVDEADAVIEGMLPAGDMLERNLPLYWIAAAGLTTHGEKLTDYGLTTLGDEVLEALHEYGTGEDLWDRETEPLAGLGTEPDRSLN